MKEYWLHYTYANADGTNRTVTSCKVKAESESDAKNILKSKYASKDKLLFNGVIDKSANGALSASSYLIY